MNGVISESVSAGSSQRVASVMCAATATVPPGCAPAGAAQHSASTAIRTSGRTARGIGRLLPSHRRLDGMRLPRVGSGRLALDPSRNPPSEVDMTRLLRSLTILGCLVSAFSLGAPAAAVAQEQPRSGGELVFVVAAEPPSFDAHREETFGMLHPGAPHYNTL